MTGYGARRRDESGAAVIEAALVLCFVVLPVTFAAISYAYMLSFRQTLSQSATEGARAAAVAPAAADRTEVARNAVNSSMATGPGHMVCGHQNLTCTVEIDPGCGNGEPHDCIKVKLSYPYRDHSLLPSIPGFGFLLPQEIGYTAVAEIS